MIHSFELAHVINNKSNPLYFLRHTPYVYLTVGCFCVISLNLDLLCMNTVKKKGVKHFIKGDDKKEKQAKPVKSNLSLCHINKKNLKNEKKKAPFVRYNLFPFQSDTSRRNLSFLCVCLLFFLMRRVKEQKREKQNEGGKKNNKKNECINQVASYCQQWAQSSVCFHLVNSLSLDKTTTVLLRRM